MIVGPCPELENPDSVKRTQCSKRYLMWFYLSSDNSCTLLFGRLKFQIFKIKSWKKRTRSCALLYLFPISIYFPIRCRMRKPEQMFQRRHFLFIKLRGYIVLFCDFFLPVWTPAGAPPAPRSPLRRLTRFATI